MRQSLAINLFIVGLLQGDTARVSVALERLEASLTTAGRFVDRSAQGVLMVGHFVLGDEAGVRQYEDPALRSLLLH